MEAERRSTMSSLKGQLSNVEGSVKTMKAAVVVGSVLTVACLAAVFGVTIAANEVSKEVKVSNGTLVSKAGNGVSVSNSGITSSPGISTESFTFELNGAKVTAKVNAVFANYGTTIFIADDCVMENSNSVRVNPESLLASVTGSVESRNLNGAACALAWYWCIMIASVIAKGVHYAVNWMLDNAAWAMSTFYDMLMQMEFPPGATVASIGTMTR